MQNAGNYVWNGVTLAAQFVAGYLLGLALLVGESTLAGSIMNYSASNPGGGPIDTALQTGSIALGATLGTWLAGWAAARLRKLGFMGRRFFGYALIGALLGMIVIWVTPPTGFMQFLYPVAGALAGYWLIPLARK